MVEEPFCKACRNMARIGSQNGFAHLRVWPCTWQRKTRCKKGSQPPAAASAAAVDGGGDETLTAATAAAIVAAADGGGDQAAAAGAAAEGAASVAQEWRGRSVTCGSEILSQPLPSFAPRKRNSHAVILHTDMI